MDYLLSKNDIKTRVVSLYLNMKSSGQLVATLCSHGLILSVMERMEGKVLNLLIVLQKNTQLLIHKCYKQNIQWTETVC